MILCLQLTLKQKLSYMIKLCISRENPLLHMVIAPGIQPTGEARKVMALSSTVSMIEEQNGKWRVVQHEDGFSKEACLVWSINQSYLPRFNLPFIMESKPSIYFEFLPKYIKICAGGSCAQLRTVALLTLTEFHNSFNFIERSY